MENTVFHSKPVFRLYHVGVNAESYDEARQAAQLLRAIFSLGEKESPKAVFADPAVEILFDKQRGTHGHIGFATADMDQAVAWLRSQGFDVDEATYVRRPNGKYPAVYLKQEVLGFALHLVEMKE